MQTYGAVDLKSFLPKHRFYDLDTKRMADVAEKLAAQMMATATLINVATPGPALALSAGGQSVAEFGSQTTCGSGIGLNMAGTGYNLNSIVLGAGTWVVWGTVWNISSGTYTTAVFLNSASGTASNSWTVANQGSGTNTGTPAAVAAVIKLAGSTTIYLNATTTLGGKTAIGMMYATQIA